MTPLERAKAYAAAARKRNKYTYCDCDACIEKEAAETLAKVQRIIAARGPVKAKVYTIQARSK